MLRIAIDGPGGAGKSTIAKLLARELDMEYVDTGAMYRAIGLKVLNSNISTDDEPAIAELLKTTEIDFQNGRILLDGVDVSEKIRTPEVSMAASDVSKQPAVREMLVAFQRSIAEGKSVVMDGRDIGTNVIKDAEVKIFLTADAMIRANRRYEQLVSADKPACLEEIYEDIKARDYQDTHRVLNPLTQADDAILLDTSDMTIRQVVDAIKAIAEKVV